MNDFASESNELPSLALLSHTNAPALKTETDTDDSDLQPRWDQAIVALLSEPSLARAASSAGISQATLWRWMQQPEFARRYRQAQRQVLTHTIARLQATASDAAAVLHEIALNPAIPASARVSAARSILENAMKAAEFDTVVERMSDLERTLAEMGKKAEEARLATEQARVKEQQTQWGGAS